MVGVAASRVVVDASICDSAGTNKLLGLLSG
jgi:hypothetical protein